MKVNLHTPIEEVQVQIIPFIDVIFCILTFFILAALQIPRQHAAQQGINVDLPKVKPGTDKSISSLAGRQILPVTVDAIGQTYVEKQPRQTGAVGGNFKEISPTKSYRHFGTQCLPLGNV